MIYQQTKIPVTGKVYDFIGNAVSEAKVEVYTENGRKLTMIKFDCFQGTGKKVTIQLKSDDCRTI